MSMFQLTRQLGRVSLCNAHSFILPRTSLFSKIPSTIFTPPSIFSRSITMKANDIALNTLRDNPGAKTQKTRVGRGIGSGKGKTAGRGHGGAKSRSGRAKPAPGFEGGQTPLYKKMRKYGFTNAMFKRVMVPLNLNQLQFQIDAGRIDPSQTITMHTLYRANAITKISHGVKLLGVGAEHFKYPINIEVTDCSATAREAVERNGGNVKLVYYNRLGLRALLFPEKFDVIPQLARPPPKLLPKYPEWKEIIAQRNEEVRRRRVAAGLPVAKQPAPRTESSKEATAEQ
eukprot:TRINITY_DN4448_c0_g1_i2.p1 TRINITY_DN4448_c0_g1~~TRINITY_DN4448_c0_g1_i2.p1  ORF type:complete len:286 (+),score=36.00 TRINITY_DN4448_c0_g1_i2:80-937(+)